MAAACEREDRPPEYEATGDAPPGYNAFVRHVQSNRVGVGADQWIEMRNTYGEWEKTGLIFSYFDDYEECVKALAGLKATNYEREYRCVPAN